MTPRRRRNERGFAVAAVVALTGLLVVVALVGAAGGRVLVEQRRAARAADLAALSAASSVQRGRPACPSARQTAGANGAGLTDCRVIGEVVVVETTVTVPAFFGRTMLVRARARAGPVGP
jgi:secretion/DNA translocation related TadE-like protein